MKLLIVIGTRPEAIKMISVIQSLKKDKFFKVSVCSTGQHKEMLDDVLKKFKIKIQYNLNLMKKNQSLSYITEGVINGLTKIIERTKPEIVIVHGDTISSFAASVAAYYNMIPIAHVESGLRTNSIYSPWPEEGSRRIIDTISSFHFCPTILSKKALIREGVSKKNIFVTGNTVLDALFLSRALIKKDNILSNRLKNKFDYLSSKRKIVLVTAHRRENFGEPFKNICAALINIAKKYKNLDIVYPIHSNPNIKIPGKKYLSNISNIYLIEPIDYFSFIYLMEKCYVIITDSGGIQEEAPSFKKPVLILREETERIEVIKTKAAKLVGTDQKKIVREFDRIIKSKKVYEAFTKKSNPYGDGKASERIAKTLKNFFK